MIRGFSCLLFLSAAALQLTTGASHAQNVNVTVDPNDGADVLYLRTSPPKANGKSTSLLALRVGITNNDASALHLNNVTFTFQGNPAVPNMSIPVTPALAIAKGATAVWTNNVDVAVNNLGRLPSPPPQTLALKLSFNGFAQPVTVTKTLKLAVADFTYPGHLSDRKAGEFWKATAGLHRPGDQGSQLLAYDMAVVGFDPQTQAWSEILPGTTGTKNSDWRIWGAPVHAMADGKVVEFMNNVATNVTVGQTNPGICGVQGAGNHFYLQHGGVTVLYAHMQPGTLNPNLLTVGAQVKRGDVLGLAGNAGSSSNPHLHIHAMIGAIGSATVNGVTCVREIEPLLLRPLPFHDASMIDLADVNTANFSGPWVKANGDGPVDGGANASVRGAVCFGAAPTAAGPALAAQIKSLEAEKTSLQQDLQKAAGSAKAAIVAEIKAIIAQEAPLKKKLGAYNAARCPIDRVT